MSVDLALILMANARTFSKYLDAALPRQQTFHAHLMAQHRERVQKVIIAALKGLHHTDQAAAHVLGHLHLQASSNRSDEICLRASTLHREAQLAR